jgi:hypothetical protein
LFNQPAFKYSFKRRDKARKHGDSSSIRIAPDQTVDPDLLFQQFVVVSQTGEVSMKEVLNFKLSNFLLLCLRQEIFSEQQMSLN